jgi:hypothetical protein
VQGEPLLVKVMENGKITRKLPSLNEIREAAAESLSMSSTKELSFSLVEAMMPLLRTQCFIALKRQIDFFFASFSILVSVAAPMPRGGVLMILRKLTLSS